MLAAKGITLALDPFTVHLRSRHSAVADGLRLFYSDRTVLADGFADFHIRIAGGPGPLLRRCELRVDDEAPFYPLPADQAFAAFEWGLNWCISTQAHDWLIVHAAVLARGDEALVLPGPPGSGKSTLSAALMLAGWRLLSDELTLLDLETLEIAPILRPFSLKNRSIDLIGERGPELVFSTPIEDTAKGRICHASPSAASIAGRGRAAKLRWLVLPRFGEGRSPELLPMDRSQGVLELLKQSFNVQVLGETAFNVACRAMDRATAFEYRYGALDEAVARLEDVLLAGEAAACEAP